MISLKKKSDCCGCGACYNACACGAISMQYDDEGFLYPTVDTSMCTGCNKCVYSCPVTKVTDNLNENQTGYWVMNADEQIRDESSSGGFFTLLAEKTINEGGVVFGAVMSEDCRTVNHIVVDNTEELYRLRGSKYIQSNIGATYNEAAKYLNAEIPVLFSGTPCQIEGLLDFLGKDYENLFCVDFICHGVPSSLVWCYYVDYIEDFTGAVPESVAFRDKRSGWKNYSLTFRFSDNPDYSHKFNDDLFLKAFLSDICLRPSCYSCRFKKLHRRSDVTMGDLWGIEMLLPEIDNDKGVSFVITHNAKAQRALESLAGKMKYGKIDINSALKYNSAMLKSAGAPKGRKSFFDNLDRMKFPDLVKKYARPDFYRIVRRKLGRVNKAIFRR